jgi:D-3-phosphoglycerate dehydrogenase
MRVAATTGKIVVTDHCFRSIDTERAVLEPAGFEVEEHQCRTADAVRAACAGAIGVLNCYAPMPAAVLEELRDCRGIARYGIGIDTIDIGVASAQGIVVTNVPDYCTEEVALHAVALLLAAHRRIVKAHDLAARGRWDPLAAGTIRRLEGQLLGLVGLGRIARSVAAKARGLGLRLGAVDPYVPSDDWPTWIERFDTLEELLTRADFVSLHAPLERGTRALIDEAALAHMRPHAVLVNTARGGLVDSGALRTALREHRIGAAALDVLAEEPPPPHHPLLRHPDVILTPHQAGYSEEAMREQQQKAAEELLAVLTGGTPRYVVNAPTPTVELG